MNTKAPDTMFYAKVVGGGKDYYGRTIQPKIELFEFSKVRETKAGAFYKAEPWAKEQWIKAGSKRYSTTVEDAKKIACDRAITYRGFCEENLRKAKAREAFARRYLGIDEEY